MRPIAAHLPGRSRAARGGGLRNWMWGIAITAIVITLQSNGQLDATERWFSNQRIRFCQFFVKTPAAPQVLVVIIDDQSLSPSSMGAWPWPRSEIARMIDEIKRCGARTIGIDVLFADPKPDDDVLAGAVSRAGNVVLPVYVDLAGSRQVEESDRARERLRTTVIQHLSVDRELWPEQIAQSIAASPVTTPSTATARAAAPDPAMLARVKAVYDDALATVLLRRISAGIAQGKTDEQIHQDALPRDFAAGGRSQLSRTLADLITRTRAANAIRNRLPRLSELPPLLTGDLTANVTVERIVSAAKWIGFVDYKVVPGGQLLWAPLLANVDDRPMPQFALAIACAQLGIDPRDPNQLRVTDDFLELLAPDWPPVRVPVRLAQTKERKLWAGTLFEIPLHGTAENWSTALDDGTKFDHVISAKRISDLLARTKSLRNNNVKIDEAIRFFLGESNKAQLRTFENLSLPPDEFTVRREWLYKVMGNPFLKDRFEEFRGMKPDELKQYGIQGQNYLNAFPQMESAASANEALVKEIESARGELTRLMRDRVVIVGFGATGMMDRVPTALHSSAPGVIVHAAIVNAILGGEMWRKAPRWLDLLITAVMGFAATWMVACRGQYRAHLAALTLIIGYALLNGFVLFDYGDYLVTLGYPTVAVATVWGVIVARRALIEAFERATVEGEFRTYVDPALVDHLLETNKPPGGRLRAERREMSIAFLDLEGFTSKSEKLKSRAARVVNSYMTLLVQVIRENGGYVNKFLGDGIMFFFNAPRRNPNHAACAVRTVLQIQLAVHDVVAGRKPDGRVHRRRRTGFRVRVGVSTGEVTVGDAGSSDASDYTVLGDIANLGSRLESANKQLGTSSLLTARTAELCDGEFLMRPLGRFRVIGRAEPVDVVEPLALARDATPCQVTLFGATRDMVERFQAADFTACIAAIERLEQLLGPHPCKLTTLYRAECQRWRDTPVPANWNAVIELREK